MYFDEFVELTEKITSEFAFGILDCLYTHVPCIQNHFVMRSNFLRILKSGAAGKNAKFQQPEYDTFPPPITDKLLEWITLYTDRNHQYLSNLESKKASHAFSLHHKSVKTGDRHKHERPGFKPQRSKYPLFQPVNNFRSNS